VLQLALLMDLTAAHLAALIRVRGIIARSHTCSCTQCCRSWCDEDGLRLTMMPLLLCVLQITLLSNCDIGPMINTDSMFESGAVDAMAALLQVLSGCPLSTATCSSICWSGRIGLMFTASAAPPALSDATKSAAHKHACMQ
jgi:hypothetical protein